MYRIAAIGELECVWPFKAYGATVYPATTAEEAKRAVDDCVKKKTGVVFITETAYLLAGEEIEEANALLTPAFCLLPTPGGSQGLAEKTIRQATMRAVGADIGNQ